MTESSIKDVAIIGAGPVGLFGVFQCGMMGLTCHVIDSMDEIGGQCAALYPEKPIYDIPAYPEIMAANLIDQLEKQAAPFKPHYILGHQIVSISNNDAIFSLTTSKNITIKAKSIIIAAGAGAFGPNKPPIDNLEEYEGRSVFYMVRQKESFRGKNVAIAGGGDSAVDWAISLSTVAKHVTLIHRRDKFRAAPESLNKLQSLVAEGKITLMVPYQLKSVHGDQGVLKTLVVQGAMDEKTLDVDILLPFYGLAMELGPIVDWGLTIRSSRIEIDPLTAQTNIDGIYAVGDIVSYKNKLKLILTGFSEVAMAAQSIYKRLHPHAEYHQEYSTTKGVPIL